MWKNAVAAEVHGREIAGGRYRDNRPQRFSPIIPNARQAPIKPNASVVNIRIPILIPVLLYHLLPVGLTPRLSGLTLGFAWMILTVEGVRPLLNGLRLSAEFSHSKTNPGQLDWDSETVECGGLPLSLGARPALRFPRSPPDERTLIYDRGEISSTKVGPCSKKGAFVNTRRREQYGNARKCDGDTGANH